MNQTPGDQPKGTGRPKRDAVVRFRTYPSVKERAEAEARLRRVSVGKLLVDAFLNLAPAPRRSPAAEAIRAESRLLVGISQQLADCQRLLRQRECDLDTATILFCQIEIEEIVAELIALSEARLSQKPVEWEKGPGP